MASQVTAGQCVILYDESKFVLTAGREFSVVVDLAL
jgi:hypothetical protein